MWTKRHSFGGKLYTFVKSIRLMTGNWRAVIRPGLFLARASRKFGLCMLWGRVFNGVTNSATLVSWNNRLDISFGNPLSYRLECWSVFPNRLREDLRIFFGMCSDEKRNPTFEASRGKTWNAWSLIVSFLDEVVLTPKVSIHQGFWWVLVESPWGVMSVAWYFVWHFETYLTPSCDLLRTTFSKSLENKLTGKGYDALKPELISRLTNGFCTYNLCYRGRLGLMICQSIYVICSILAIIRVRSAQGKRAS